MVTIKHTLMGAKLQMLKQLRNRNRYEEKETIETSLLATRQVRPEC
jgi:hypothetical protein